MLKYERKSSISSPFAQSTSSPFIEFEAIPQATIRSQSRHSFAKESPIRRPSSLCQSYHSDDDYTTEMADGRAYNRNEARSMRVLEIMNDFRTLQHHTRSLISRSQADPPNAESHYLDGYVVLRQCDAESQAILATHYNPGNLGTQGGNVPEMEVQKATLQRIILDSSTRRFQAHKIYLRAAAAMRWVQRRQQLLRGQKPNGRHVNDLRRIDQQLREELNGITDDHVTSDLRGADRRKGYWLEEDPSLDLILSWIRMQR